MCPWLVVGGSDGLLADLNDLIGRHGWYDAVFTGPVQVSTGRTALRPLRLRLPSFPVPPLPEPVHGALNMLHMILFGPAATVENLSSSYIRPVEAYLRAFSRLST